MGEFAVNKWNGIIIFSVAVLPISDKDKVIQHGINFLQQWYMI